MYDCDVHKSSVVQNILVVHFVAYYRITGQIIQVSICVKVNCEAFCSQTPTKNIEIINLSAVHSTQVN